MAERKCRPNQSKRAPINVPSELFITIKSAYVVIDQLLVNQLILRVLVIQHTEQTSLLLQ